jgi:hypothetical protein
VLLNVFATETVIDETTGKENKFKLQKKKNDDARLQFQHQKQMYSRVIKKDEMLLHNTKEIFNHILWIKRSSIRRIQI